MKTLFLKLFSTCIFLTISANGAAKSYVADSKTLKPRIVIMTDIGPGDVEPDDMESAVRLLAYADRFEIEALITTIGWNCDPYPTDWAEYLHQVIDGYGTDVKNLMKRSAQTVFMSVDAERNKPQKLGYWPSVEYIRQRTVMGSQRAGIGVIGEGNDTDGSRLIIQLVDEADERPIWFCAWGGANTLAQAVWRVKKERSKEELDRFLHKIRLYTITDQDMQYNMRMNRAYSSHQWLRQEFANDLMLIWDESAWLTQCELGSKNWELYAKYVQGHGQMGAVYPRYKYGVEGDTPSFLHVMPNGLNDPDDPEQVGWGGYHQFGMSPDSITDAWTNWQPSQKSISRRYEEHFYPDEFNDFAARMQWAAEGKGNRNPVVIVNGIKGLQPVVIKAVAGKTVKLNATQSYDFDNDQLKFHWWQQPEAGTYRQKISVHTTDSDCLEIAIPKDAQGKSLHFVCEVHDSGPFNLVSYRRIIIHVK